MTTTEHLQLIKAECERLLALSEADPRWWCPVCLREVSPQMVRYDETHDGCGALVEWQESAQNAPAEAGWRATIGVIDMSTQMINTDLTFIVDEILAAWPLELLQKP